MQIPIISTLPDDRLRHALMGASIFAIVGAFVAWLGYPGDARIAGALAAALAGAGKEASDYLLNKRAVARGEIPPHGVEFADFAATLGGALFVWGAAIATGG